MILRIFFFFSFWVGVASTLPAQTLKDDIESEITDLLKQGKTQDALRRINMAIEAHPKMGSFYVLRAKVVTNFEEKLSQGIQDRPDAKYEQALRDLEMAELLKELSISVTYARFRLFVCYQQYELALGEARKLEKMDLVKDNDGLALGILLSISALYHDLGKHKEARDIMLNLLKNKPNEYVVNAQAGLLYGRLQEFDKSNEHFEKALQYATKKDEKVHILVNQGYVNGLAKNYKKAVKVYNTLLEEYYQDIPKAKIGYCYNNRGYAQMGLGKLKEAEQDINTSLKYYPENSYAFRNRGLLYLKMGKKDLACADFQKAEEYGYSKSYGNEVKELLKEHCK
jgi:tetratricopeptide (TPR) repeat protein